MHPAPAGRATIKDEASQAEPTATGSKKQGAVQASNVVIVDRAPSPPNADAAPARRRPTGGEGTIVMGSKPTDNAVPATTEAKAAPDTAAPDTAAPDTAAPEAAAPDAAAPDTAAGQGGGRGHPKEDVWAQHDGNAAPVGPIAAGGSQGYLPSTDTSLASVSLAGIGVQSPKRAWAILGLGALLFVVAGALGMYLIMSPTEPPPATPRFPDWTRRAAGGNGGRRHRA